MNEYWKDGWSETPKNFTKEFKKQMRESCEKDKKNPDLEVIDCLPPDWN